MKNAFDVLMERGFIEQTTHEEEIKALLAKEKVVFYIGFDPTADSLTVGHFVTIMAMAHMQRNGHIPIAVVGGGTGMVGDPTDKTDMRRMMTKEEVNNNVNCFKAQLEKFIDFSDNKAYMVDNGDWLLQLQYVPFIREYGVHFSVNRMLTADSYKSRFEKGLTFFEFNYQLMQAYDFLELYRRYGCKMQFGGNDQWSNIIAGVELIRRKEGASAYGMTFKLLTTSSGKKMGKSEKGAVWLDPNKTTPYEFFQYFRNVDDSDVLNCLRILTFLPLEEIDTLMGTNSDQPLTAAEINKAKEVLAYEVTKNVHSKEAADEALAAARALFGGGQLSGSVPTTELTQETIGEGMNIIDLLEACGLIPTRSEGRRLVTQGGITLDGNKISDLGHTIKKEDFNENKILIQKGKKIFHNVILK